MDSVSDAAFRFIGGSWRPYTAARYGSVWRSFKDFLSARGVFLLSVDLTVVLDYLTLLADRGLAYSMIALHRSVLSATLPPLISRLLCGIFQNRPPTRRFFPSWNVAAVFAVFSSSRLPFGYIDLQRKLAFLLAMASSRRPSEVASLCCGSAYMVINANSVRFLPSRLSKTDRPGHLGPPILIRRSPAATFLSAPSPLSKTFWFFAALPGSRTFSSFLLLLLFRRFQRRHFRS